MAVWRADVSASAPPTDVVLLGLMCFPLNLYWDNSGKLQRASGYRTYHGRSTETSFVGPFSDTEG